MAKKEIPFSTPQAESKFYSDLVKMEQKYAAQLIALEETVKSA